MAEDDEIYDERFGAYSDDTVVLVKFSWPFVAWLLFRLFPFFFYFLTESFRTVRFSFVTFIRVLHTDGATPQFA